MDKSLSYLDASEVPEAKRLINEGAGFQVPDEGPDAPRVCGYQLLIRIHMRESETKPFTKPDGTTASIVLPDMVTAMDKYRSCVGLVLGMGPDCYKGERFKESGPWCRVGDWVAFPRHEGTQLVYKGMPVQVINDDKVLLVIADPDDVVRE